MTERVSVELTDGVADVRLTRGDKMNALDDAMFQALIDTGDRLKRERGLRAVVLSGEGRAFCAGLDMGRFGKMAEAKEAAGARNLGLRSHGIANRPQYAVWVWRELPVPVIAAVHGVAFGGGFQIMLAADMRYVAPGTRLSIMEIKWGLVPDMAGTQLLRHLAEVVHVEPGAEGAAFAGQHDGAHAGLGLQPLSGRDQRLEHGVVERVHLVRPHHAHVGDAVRDGDRDAIVHRSCLPFRATLRDGRRGGQARSLKGLQAARARMEVTLRRAPASSDPRTRAVSRTPTE